MFSVVLTLSLICGCNANWRAHTGESSKMMRRMTRLSRADVDLDEEDTQGDLMQVQSETDLSVQISPSGMFQKVSASGRDPSGAHFSVSSSGSKTAGQVAKKRKSTRSPSFRAMLFTKTTSRSSTKKLACGKVFSVPGVAEDAECPDACPYLAEDVTNSSAVCRFQCVQKSRCSAVNPNQTIADDGDMICRSCSVEACEECLHNGEDVCKTCAPRYDLQKDGSCEDVGHGAWLAFLVISGIAGVCTLLYCTQLCCRANVNNDAVQRGIRDRWRSRNKPRDDEDNEQSARDSLLEDPRAKKWPITTNLCTTPVAGPGLLLYFNFQCLVIVWTILVLLGWSVTASMLNGDLFTLGIRDAETPREVCTVVDWGHNTQAKYMYAKVIFMGGVYVVTFLMLIIHATLQYRRYQDVDDSTTMKDFCAYVTGLPEFHGSELAEERVKQVIEAATGEKVVGVSLCWNFNKEDEKVMKSLEYDMCRMDEERLALLRADERGRRAEQAGLVAELTGFKKVMRKMDNALITFLWGWEQSEDPNVDEEELVKSITSHKRAFVVFNEEAARDAAVSAVKRMGKGIAFEGGAFAKLYKQGHEPEGVQWLNFGYDAFRFLMRLMCGLVMIFIGLCVWAAAVYVPYALYFTSYPYAQGDEPSIPVQIAFTFMVTAGNEILYALTGWVCEWVGFKYRDGINTAYLLIYTSSCFLCVILDLIISCFMVYTQLKKSDAFTSSGVMVVDLSTYKAVFESYPMQKALGWELFIFAFPACMLAPFVVEPFIFIWMPYWVGWALVKSRPDLDATMSEKCLGFTQDIEPNARYADLILNVMLCIIIFFFPPGYIMITFTCLLVSHVYIYWLDHWQTLRATRANYFSSQAMDVSASAFMSVPLGLLLCAIIFKFHAIPGVLPLSAQGLAAYCVIAFVLHITIHVLIVLKLVPKLGKRGHIRSSLSYPEAAKKYACNWFTANPVHCLRSKYMYKHSPPCQFFVEGKENLIKANPDIGVYYQEKDDDWMPPDDQTEINGKDEPQEQGKDFDQFDDPEDNDLAPIVDTPGDDAWGAPEDNDDIAP